VPACLRCRKLFLVVDKGHVQFLFFLPAKLFVPTLREGGFLVAGGLILPEPCLFFYNETVKIWPSGKSSTFSLCDSST